MRASLIAMAAVLALIATVALPAAASAAEPPPTLWTKCVGGLDDVPCDIPRGIAADPNPPGHVYVADQINQRMLEFDAWGRFIRAWGWDVVETGPGDDTSAPEDQFEICVPADGDVCKPGVDGEGAGQFKTAQGVALDSEGNVYVVDFFNFRVQKFDAEGNFLLMFGGDVNKTKAAEGGSTEAERNLCTKAQLESGDECGAGTTGPGQGQFAWSVNIGSFIAIDPSDNIYVGDQGRIQRFDTDGVYQGQVPVAGETIQGLATDPSGDLFVTLYDEAEGTSKPNVLKLSPLGVPLCTANGVARPRAIATDSDGHLYVYDTSTDQVHEFDASCAPLDDGFPTGFIESTGLAIGQACFSTGANLYLSHLFQQPNAVRAYGGPPDRQDSEGNLVCPPPPNPPDISAQYALAVGVTDATLRAEINPRRWGDATYYVQYGTAACIEGGGWEAPCVEEQPAPPGALGAGAVDLPVKAAVSLAGLTADTSYRFRFVAQSSGGGPVFGVGGKVGEEGADGGFRTFPPPSQLFTGCANQQFRTATSSAHLPSCRAYEMVSPVDKAGADVNARQDTQAGRDLALDQAAAVVPPEGRGLTYTARQAFGDAVAAPEMNQYLASRRKEGWTSHSLFPPQHGPDAEGPPLFKAFSTDLSYSWMWREAEPPLDPCAPVGFPNLYRRDNATEAYEALSCEPLTAPFRTELQGASDDSSHAVFRSRSALTPDARPLDPGKNEGDQLFQVYEWEEEAGLRLVSVLPSGAACAKQGSAGSASGSFDSGRWHRLATAVSADGERVYWSCDGRLYLRSGGSGPSVPVSELVSPNPAQFWAAASDGSKALFTIGALQTGDATLYQYDAIAEAATPIAGSVTGLLGQSANLERVYLISDADLDGAGEGEIGKHNLYLLEAGDFSFVVALSDIDAGDTTDAPSPGHGMPIRHNARVTPDGTHAAFMSNSKALAEEVGGLDNTDANSGEADAEVYLYDAASGELVCPSCNRSGARPAGRDIGVELHPYWAAAKIPTWPYSLYAPRALSDDGERLFFESFEALVLRDTNARQDVYEWQDGTGQEDCESRGAELFVAGASGAGGCLSLISTGKDESDSDFTDASADGSDVFFKTQQSLVGQDPGQRDIYDARIGGGFPPPPGPPPGCEGGNCQPPVTAPDPPTPGSSAYRGDEANEADCEALRRRANRLRAATRRLRKVPRRAESPGQVKALRRRAAANAKRAKALRRQARRCQSQAGGSR